MTITVEKCALEPAIGALLDELKKVNMADTDVVVRAHKHLSNPVPRHYDVVIRGKVVDLKPVLFVDGHGLKLTELKAYRSGSYAVVTLTVTIPFAAKSIHDVAADTITVKEVSNG